MKKLIFIMALIFAFCSVEAQITKTKTLNANTFYFVDATNTTLSTTTDSTLTYTFTLNKSSSVLYDVQLVLDSAAASTRYVIDLKGKVFADDAWSDLETDVIWTATEADTTILFQEHSTAEFMRFFQLQVNGSTGTGDAVLDKVEFKIWD